MLCTSVCIFFKKATMETSAYCVTEVLNHLYLTVKYTKGQIIHYGSTVFEQASSQQNTSDGLPIPADV